MSEESELQKAVDLLNAGNEAEVRELLLSLDPKIKDMDSRLLLIDASLSALDPIEDNSRKIALGREGINIAEITGQIALQALFQARTADNLMLPVAIRNHRRAMLKLSPDWIGFSTEADQHEHEKLSEEVNSFDKEIDSLLSNAEILAERSGNKKILGYVLSSRGSVESSRYLQFKTECIRGWRSKFWVKYDFMRYPFFEYILTFTNGDAKKINVHMRIYRESFLKAARVLEEINDPGAGPAYHNLANDLRTAYRFREAKKYLAKARAIAIKHNDISSIKKAEELEKSIYAKNKDIPDYINGERREKVQSIQKEGREDAGPSRVKKVRSESKMPGRNDPCYCGSGKKYKKCHIK